MQNYILLMDSPETTFFINYLFGETEVKHKSTDTCIGERFIGTYVVMDSRSISTEDAVEPNRRQSQGSLRTSLRASLRASIL